MKKGTFLLFLSLISFQLSSKDILYGIGDIVSDFALTNINSGQEFKLSSLNSKKAIVLYFTDLQCPYAKLTDDVMKTLSEKYAEKNIAFVAINPNPAADQSQIISALKNKPINYPYLLDPKQIILKQFSILKAPTVVLLKKSGPTFVLEYRGAINANASTPDQVDGFYIKDAIDATLINQALKTNETPVRGCTL